jgi:MFS family permease
VRHSPRGIAFGLVSAAFGVGMISASLGLSIRRTSVAVTTLLIVAWLASGSARSPPSRPPIVVAALAQAVGGFGNGLENVAADTLIQQAVPREMLERVFGLVTTAAFGGSDLAYAAGHALLDLTSPAPSSSSPAPASSPSPPTSGSPSATQHHRTTPTQPG